jgi:surface protein
MYIGELKYSIEIDETTTNTLSVPTGETIIDVKVNNQNPVDTYYKLLYLKNSNLTVKYYETTKDTDEVVTTYSKPNDSIAGSNSNNIKLLITNNSTSSQNVAFTMKGGYITNTIQDITTPSTYSEITLVETPSTNTYFCTTTDTLTQGLQYVNGQYTYKYMQEGKYADSGLAWQNITSDGWGVQLTDKASTNAVTSKVCTYINNVPITSMSYMFAYSQATTLDVSNFDTSNVTNMRSMFSNSKATTLDVSNFDTSNVTYMNIMFGNSQATTLDVSNFDTSNVTTMAQMFESSQATTLDVSNFDTSKVTSMGSMFQLSQATTLDLSNFNTTNVTNMSWMFYYSKATTLDVSNFDTSKVTNMGSMFVNSKATTLDLSNFNTSNVTNMSYMFNTSTNLKTIYVGDKFNTNNVTSSANMFTDSTKLVGGAGTKYNSSYVDKTYARIDGGTSNPGYFTDIADKDIPAPNSFATDSWKTIIKAVKNNNISKYHVGDTRTIDMGTYGTHTLRIANTSTPSECSTAGFSQTACGFVLEFADIITTHNMNPKGEYKGTQYDYGWNVDGWPASSMYTFVNNDIYNVIPSEIKNAIIDTTVVSGHGSTSGETNFTSTDKLYLLSTAEVWAQGSSNTIEYDTARDVTRQLDYYKNLGTSTSNYSGAIKKNGTSDSYWWLRAAGSYNAHIFLPVTGNGDWTYSSAASTYGVAPAFRLG